VFSFAALDAHIQAVTEETTMLKPAPLPPALKENDNEKKRKATSQISKGVSKLMKVNY
jgi:hypothetical protein